MKVFSALPLEDGVGLIIQGPVAHVVNNVVHQPPCFFFDARLSTKTRARKTHGVARLPLPPLHENTPTQHGRRLPTSPKGSQPTPRHNFDTLFTAPPLSHYSPSVPNPGAKNDARDLPHAATPTSLEHPFCPKPRGKE